METNPAVVPPVQNQVATPGFFESLPECVDGLEDLSGHGTSSYIAVVHGSSDPERQALGVGSLILVPDLQVLAAPGQPLAVAVLAMWVTWETIRDNKDPLKNDKGHIVERSFDPCSDVAVKSKSPATWAEPYLENPNLVYNHVECYNYTVRILEGPSAGVITQVTFSKTSHKFGRRLNGFLTRKMAQMRRAIYAFRVSLKTDTEPNSTGNTHRVLTWDFDETNPSSVSNMEEYNELTEMRQGALALLDVMRSQGGLIGSESGAPKNVTPPQQQAIPQDTAPQQQQVAQQQPQNVTPPPQQSVHVQPQQQQVAQQQPQGGMPIPADAYTQVAPGEDPSATPF